MWPLLAGLATRGAATSATRSAVTSAASSGSISAGTASARSSRLLSAAQFAGSGVRATQRDKPAQSSAPPAQTVQSNQPGWLRS